MPSSQQPATLTSVPTPSQVSRLPPSGDRCALELVLCGLVMVASSGLLAWRSQGAPTVSFLMIALFTSWAAVLWAWRAADHLGAARILPVLWTIGIAVRVIGFAGAPLFEDDWYRYLWDGRQLATTGNPYGLAPQAHFADETVPDAFQTVLSNLNNPDVPTIYGPVCQFIFALSYWIAPAQLWPLKCFLIAADLLILWLLLKLTTPRHALFYAWCPLLLQETAFAAHPEILGVVFIVAALWSWRQQRYTWLAIFCACAVAARIHAILLLPFLFWPFRWRALVAFTVTLALIYSPFWLQGSAADLSGLAAFLGQWEFNSSVFALVKSVAGWNAAKLLTNAAFILVFLALFTNFARRQAGWESSNRPQHLAVYTQLVLAAFFLLSAVVNPWYLLWLVPFVALRPSVPGLVALMAVSLSYIHGGTIDVPGLAPYEHPKWLRPLEYGLILAAAAYAGRSKLLSAEHKTH